MPIKSISPATGQLVREYSVHSEDQVLGKIRAAEEAFQPWRERSFAERRSLMRAAAERLLSEKSSLAELITTEMGKPIAQAEAEVKKCAWGCRHYADQADHYLALQVIETDASFSGVAFQPLGAILAIMPWNFPFWQVFRFAAPALMAGNVAVLKHASNVPECSLAIEKVFADAGFPPGVFASLLIESSAVESVIRNPVIKAVTLTGSDKAGRSVAAIAGSQIKKTVLELGGSDPFIVLADAELETTVAGAVQARTQNAGQSCIAAKRFIVDKRIEPEFTSRFVEAVRDLKVGDPMDRETQVGPMAREDLVDDLHKQVESSIAAGAQLLTGGKRIGRPGFFYEPTVLSRVRPGMAAFDEETFGPVAAVIAAADEDDAIDLANRTAFGLGATIWSADADRARELAMRVDAGSVFVNGIVKSDPRLPFGGVKNSGYGRELSAEGIREFVNIKTVWVR